MTISVNYIYYFMKNETLKLEKIDGVFFSVAFIGFSLHPLTSLALLTCLPALNKWGCSKAPCYLWLTVTRMCAQVPMPKCERRLHIKVWGVEEGKALENAAINNSGKQTKKVWALIVPQHGDCAVLSRFSRVWLCAPRNGSLPVSLSVGFSRQEYWHRLPFPSPEDLPDPGIEPACLTSNLHW